ncbi:aspartate/glutamate racemase family protein [Candidatus Saccharibacteria bacterium]|nr:aspartate/glutamate racemase family protein [Candidatus Saccharibacteria bacterium]MCB9821731.1 aspartate/glutamate racemase family protein [Candidatus Nomurabacteria bacterium]
MKKHNPKIGIVSGIGPLAGSDVFAKLLKYAADTYDAVEDSEYPDVVLVNHGIEGVDNIGTLNPQFEADIVAMVKQLEQNGANVIGMACNTAHIYLSKIKTNSSTTLVNLIDEVAKEASKANTTYLLLTSSTSKKQSLYQSYLKKYKVAFQVTNSEQQKLLDEAIGLVMAYKLKEAGRLLAKVLKSAKNTGFDAVIAGCTELPIAIDNTKNTDGLTIVSSNEVLAKTLAAHYYHQH